MYRAKRHCRGSRRLKSIFRLQRQSWKLVGFLRILSSATLLVEGGKSLCLSLSALQPSPQDTSFCRVSIRSAVTILHVVGCYNNRNCRRLEQNLTWFSLALDFEPQEMGFVWKREKEGKKIPQAGIAQRKNSQICLNKKSAEQVSL